MFSAVGIDVEAQPKGRFSVLRTILTITIALALAGAAHAGSHDMNEGNGIVAPSEYVESIETEGDTGGVMDEVDSAEAQAEAAEAAKKKAAAKAADADEGGW